MSGWKAEPQICRNQVESNLQVAQLRRSRGMEDDMTWIENSEDGEEIIWR